LPSGTVGTAGGSRRAAAAAAAGKQASIPRKMSQESKQGGVLVAIASKLHHAQSRPERYNYI